MDTRLSNMVENFTTFGGTISAREYSCLVKFWITGLKTRNDQPQNMSPDIVKGP